jgi:hypothetical protein
LTWSGLVRREADAQADCIHEKGLQMQAFYEAAEGSRTLDLLHGKKNVGEGLGPQRACKMGVSRPHGGKWGVHDLPRITGDLRTD